MPDEGKNVVALTVAPDPTWLNRLQRSKSGWLPTLANALTIMANDPKFDGMMAYNDFTSQHLLMRPPPPSQDEDGLMPGPYPREWAPEDTSLIQAYMQRVWSEKFRRQDIEAAMQSNATHNRFHPVLRWLDDLVWDGKPRLDNWIINVFDPKNEGMPGSNAYDRKYQYYRAVASKFLMAAVRRLRCPGCKFDYMPIFEGGQGIGKSTVLRRLFSCVSEDHFSDSIPPDLASKDTAMALLGVWLLEFAEIEHLIRHDPEIIKAFFSRQVDRYRPPYGRSFVKRPRQGVMAGTTNSEDFFRDSTGNRRFWPIECNAADVAWVDANREQLWAEAVYREASGESIWLDDEDVISEAMTSASFKMAEEVWEPAIVEWLNNPETSFDIPVTSARVLEFALGMSKEKMTKAASMRVGAVLRSLGWVRVLRRVKVGSEEVGRPIRVWEPPQEPRRVVTPEADEWP